MPGEAAEAEKKIEIPTPDSNDSRTLGALAIRSVANLPPVNTEPLTEEQRFPSLHNFYGD